MICESATIIGVEKDKKKIYHLFLFHFFLFSSFFSPLNIFSILHITPVTMYFKLEWINLSGKWGEKKREMDQRHVQNASQLKITTKFCVCGLVGFSRRSLASVYNVHHCLQLSPCTLKHSGEWWLITDKLLWHGELSHF